MATLDSKLTEAEAVFWSMRFYKTLFDFMVGFMVSAIIIQLAGAELVYALVPAVLFAVIQLVRDYRHRGIVSYLKGKYDNLDERLQTAMEYKVTRNVIVEDLISDVTKRMDDVETSSFVDTKKLSKRVYSLIVLSFLLLTITVLNMHSLAFNTIGFLLDSTNTRGPINDFAGKAGTGFDTLMGNRWEQSNFTDENKEKLGAESGGERPGVSEGPIPGTGGGVGSDAGGDIYGEASSASIIGEDVDFRLHPEYGGEIEIREVAGTVRSPEFELGDVMAVEEDRESYVAVEHEEMVRRYFEKILPET